MAVLQYRTISNRTVAALAVERDTVFWDRQLKGFGVRVYPTGGKLYLAQARGPDGPGRPHKARRITVGRHPVLDAEEARRRAALIIARIKAGEDPVPLPLPAKHHGSPTVTDLAKRYHEQHVAVRCKPKTQRTTRSIARRHIVPALGKLPLAAVDRRHVMALHESLCETPAIAPGEIVTDAPIQRHRDPRGRHPGHSRPAPARRRRGPGRGNHVRIRDSLPREPSQPFRIPLFFAPPEKTGVGARHHAGTGCVQTPDCV